MYITPYRVCEYGHARSINFNKLRRFTIHYEARLYQIALGNILKKEKYDTSQGLGLLSRPDS